MHEEIFSFHITMLRSIYTPLECTGSSEKVQLKKQQQQGIKSFNKTWTTSRMCKSLWLVERKTVGRHDSWQKYEKDYLPEKINGIIVIIEYQCDKGALAHFCCVTFQPTCLIILNTNASLVRHGTEVSVWGDVTTAGPFDIIAEHKLCSDHF